MSNNPGQCSACGITLPRPPPLVCPHCGIPFDAQPSTPRGENPWTRLRSSPAWLQVSLVVLFLIAAIWFVVGAISGPDNRPGPHISNAEHARALNACVNGPGAAWYAEHPGVNPHDPAAYTAFAAVINRCLVDTFHIDPKYMPDKPLAPPTTP